MNQEVITHIVNEFNTPIYIYDGEKIEHQYKLLKSCLPKHFEVFYSVKANPLLGVCQLFKKLGSQIEVASLAELQTAFQAGFTPDQIIFTSPGKTIEELETSIDRQIYSINVESLEEAILINHIGQKKGRQVPISVRINPDFNLSGAGLRMTGVPTQFGIDQSQLEEALGTIQSLPYLKLIGLHIYTGSQMLAASLIIKNMEEIIKLAITVSETYAFPLQFLDLGGGFGIPYFTGEQYLDMDELGKGLQTVWETYAHKLEGTRIGVESGRFLMAESGLFVTKVLYVKESKGTKYVVCDGGSNHHASSAFLGRHIRNNFPMHVHSQEEQDELTEVTVVGSLCTPTDVIGQKVKLGKVDSGDYIVVEKSGAYGLTHSPVLFLSHQLPAEVLYKQGQVHVLRERGSVEDFFKGQKLLSTHEELLQRT
ncbi:type III PLP-dependent enzyme [Paenibacillus sp. SYP-B3998]|uniref:Type III PLP-dependent enzyme n=1 Tax=Paenibacillus sp. SYP-B3998 TaxID=2678564 RepID=A0A6G3ZX30_9BACL|nr:type III PLP-dependent enzyme [Paenibacillus sp. SYP-B3998]NEW06264.1 type III PLP-dependent enzyme [Paenibacillus sp. SYP-B3998]